MTEEDAIEVALIELTAGRHRVRPAAAAKLLNVTRARLGKTITRLESEGLLHTSRNPNDERSILVSLTAAGVYRAMSLRGTPVHAHLTP